MRVVVERGAVDPNDVERVVRGLAVDVVYARTASSNADAFVVRCAADLERLAAIVRPPLLLGPLEVTSTYATLRGARLLLRRTEAAVLYELVAAKGAPVTRSVLHARCWPSASALRNVDVAICRLRPKLEHTTKLRLCTQRDVGYWLDTSSLRKRVLVVEDDVPLHTSYRWTFEPLGIDVEFAASFADGAEMVTRSAHDAYFVDLELPGGSGADLVPMIQRRAPLAPVMIVSGRDDSAAIGLSARLGVPYAIKPFDPRELERFVQRTVLRRAV